MFNNTNYNTTDGWWLALKIGAGEKGVKLRLGTAGAFHRTAVVIHRGWC